MIVRYQDANRRPGRNRAFNAAVSRRISAGAVIGCRGMLCSLIGMVHIPWKKGVVIVMDDAWPRNIGNSQSPCQEKPRFTPDTQTGAAVGAP